MSRRYLFLAASAIGAIVFAACSDSTRIEAPVSASLSRADGTSDRGLGTDEGRIQYGPAAKLGNGTVRTYIVTDRENPRVPLEIGVAMSERSMEGLPAPMPMAASNEHGNHGAHANMTVFLLDLPQKNPTPYEFVQFDWNPAGHEPPGVYDVPHFDFHFYTVPRAVRSSIVPSDPEYATKAANFPAAPFIAPFYLDAATAAGIAPALATVPQMGLHWLDVRSPELQMMTGHPENYAPFTRTFIYGSWNGQFIFDEPMITRAYIMAKRDAQEPAVRDEIVPVSTAQRHAPPGFYPSAYRITWDARAREYRVALTQLSWRD